MSQLSDISKSNFLSNYSRLLHGLFCEKLLVNEELPRYRGNRELILRYSVVENNEVVDYRTVRELCQFFPFCLWITFCLSHLRYKFVFPYVFCIVVNSASLSLRVHYVFCFVVVTCKTIILPVVLYGCKTGSLTLREERRMRVFENRVLRRLFGPKRDEVTG